jgi:hypothetical protein
LEGDGFYGDRSQSASGAISPEVGYFKGNPISGPATPFSVNFDNDLWGGTARGTVRLQYYLGKARLARLFLDAGMQANYSSIDYTKFGLGNPSELLWGPYVKFGLRVSF